MKKRVLQLIPSFHQGGSESQAVALTKALKAEGSLDVFAATLNGEGVLRAEIDGIGLTEILEFPLTSFYDLNFARQVRSFAKYLRSNKIDIVSTHDFYTNVFGVAAAKFAGVTAVAAKRETGGVRTKTQEFVERLAFRQAKAIVANSDSVRQYLIDQGLSANKIKVIYNGVDSARFRGQEDRTSVCKEFGLPCEDDRRFVVMVANLRHDVKNVPMLLRAAKRVGEQVGNVRFIIAGEGGLRTELEGLAVRLGVAYRVHFVGRCENVPALLSIADVCVLTSMAEGFSNSILEYMAAGKPVVTTNVGGASEAIVDGKTGHLVESDDDETLAARIIELLNDADKARDLGQKGRQVIADRFSTESRLANTLELYRSLLS